METPKDLRIRLRAIADEGVLLAEAIYQLARIADSLEKIHEGGIYTNNWAAEREERLEKQKK